MNEKLWEILCYKDSNWREIITLKWFVIMEKPQKKNTESRDTNINKALGTVCDSNKKIQCYTMSWKVMKLGKYIM